MRRSARLLLLALGIPLLAASCGEPPPRSGEIRVEGAFACEALGRLPADATLVVFRLPEGTRVRASGWTAGRFHVSLPPGDYRFLFHGVEIAQASLDVQVHAGDGRLDLGTILLEPSRLARHYGKPPPPWTVAEARGLDPGSSLADFRGRWVILAFWGTW
jgi:hypothetical protein